MKKIQARERAFLMAGGVFVAAFVVLRLLQGTVFERMSSLDRRIAARENELSEMHDLAGRHRAVQGRLGALELRLDEQGTESFLTRLDGITRDARLNAHLDGIQPQGEVEIEGFLQSTWEAKFSRLSLAQISDLLQRISLGRALIQIQRLNIERRFENALELDLTLILASYQRKR